MVSVEANGNLLYIPELLRIKATLLLRVCPSPTATTPKQCLLRALELSRRQGARAWELRTAIDLATLMAGRGENDKARALLRPVFGHFVEGLDTADLRTAESLLARLR